MAFDGSVVAALCDEFNNKLKDGRINKIVQPEKDELLLTIKSSSGQHRLLISVNPSLPTAYLTEENKTAPLTAPSFCMLLRKHIQSGRIVGITQPSLERIINIEIEHYNEMGDLCSKILTIELMGKHSNIIFRDGDKILDSIRHVSGLVSSVREVLPGREYFIPFEGDKLNPFATGLEEMSAKVCTGSLQIFKSLYTNVTGLSPQLAEEIVYNAGLDGERSAESLSLEESISLYQSFARTISQIKEGNFEPSIIYENGAPSQFCALKFNIYADYESADFDSISQLLYTYYASRQSHTNIKQKTTDLRQIVQNLLTKNYKKYDLQLKQIKDTEKKDKYRVYGELLTAYGYQVEPKSTSYKCIDFYSGEKITIPLDPTLSAIENGKKFFEKYNKLKRTADSLNEIIEDTRSEIEHLESISASLDTVANEADIADIRREMTEAGYIKSKAAAGASGKNGANSSGKKSGNSLGKSKGIAKAVKSEPMHYISSDGFHMYVGKNNYQNEYITFKLADGGDWWFHAKKLPGSHVIVKTEGRELPDRTFEEAASLAAHYCKAEGAGKVEVDYIQRKSVKKTPGGKPGFVIYHENYSMVADTDISGIQEI